ncbi:MAG: winged helix-turn-helix transcriptional regulator [Alphaproteobacteria bacterium]
MNAETQRTAPYANGAAGADAEAASTASTCPMDYILRQLMGPWTTYILWVLRTKGPLRFGALKKEVAGISAKMLTERLRTLERAELIYRSYETTVPPKVTYGLAPRGLELQPILDAFAEIGRRWQAENAARRVVQARPRQVAE